MIRQAYENLIIYEFALFAPFRERLTAGVTARAGGHSLPPYASLNLALHVGDDPALVIANRRTLCEKLGLDFERYTCAQQTHGANCRMVTSDLAGRGRLALEDAIPDTDALLTAERDIPITICLADCAPIVFYDPIRHVGAVTHAGWQSTALRIAQQTAHYLQLKFDCRAEDILAGIGPAIGACCYQVSQATVDKLTRSFPYDPPIHVIKDDGRPYPDIAQANYQQLRAAGLPAEHIELSGICASCRAEEFFSERKLGRPTGRFSAYLCLR
ncbi:MAG: peptidoglycan editing factor PgeF [Armatimonadota bacterium]